MIDDTLDTGYAQSIIDELCGVTPKEIAGLLARIMKRENQISSSAVNGKRVRRFKASFMSMPIHLTEVNTRFVSRQDAQRIHKLFASSKRPFQYDPYTNGADFHVESDEWEFKVRVESSMSTEGTIPFAGLNIRIRSPWFEGDQTNYKHQMSMIRLMGLTNINSEDVYLG